MRQRLKIGQNLSEKQFLQEALALFHFQFENNLIYNEFCKRLQVKLEQVDSLEKIPFLPISFFKTHKVVTTDFNEEMIFYSSGTSGKETSKHYIKSLALYEKSIVEAFRFFYGDPRAYNFFILLPNYLENKQSSLIFMMDKLITAANSGEKNPSGFYLADHDILYRQLIDEQKSAEKKTILFGVSYALLDFVKKYQLNFPKLIVFETGGMKGRGKEIVKEELHAILKSGFGVKHIHSEYGMCELLSQAYSKGGNLFSTPPWMKLLLRDEKEPIYSSLTSHSGIINVIDLANIYSCAFIATEDIGRKNEDNQVEILGRLDATQIRGCNLLGCTTEFPFIQPSCE